MSVPSKDSKILIIDDEAPIRDVLSASLKDDGYQVEVAQDGLSGLATIEKYQPHVVLLDIWMPGKLDGLDVLSQSRRQFPNVEFVIMSGHGTIDTAVKATKLGAWDFVEKPLSMEKVLILISNIRAFQVERGEKNILLNKLRQNISIIGDSAPIKQLKQLASRVAATENWLIIEGQDGSGRTLLAQNIHYMSARAGKPFVDLNCSFVPEDLIESELFGFERGAFTGAASSKKGKMDLAQGGTLFLDDVTSLPLKTQSRLLKMLQDGRFERMGGTESISADVRVIAATKKNLSEEVLAGRFREDLYQRLNTVSLKLPSLVDRIDDLPALLDHFCEYYSRESGTRMKSFSQESLDALKKHDWPGNVREVKNFVERLYILTPTIEIEPDHLELTGIHVPGGHVGENGEALVSPSFKAARALFERQYILKKLEEYQGNISKTAEMIGLERSHLHRKIKAYGIEVPVER